VQVRQAEAAVLLVDLHAERAEVGQPAQHLVGNVRVALDGQAVDPGHELAQLGEEHLGPGRLGGVGLGAGVDQVETEPAEEQFLAEARLAPLGLPSRLGDLARLLLGDVPAVRTGHYRPPARVVTPTLPAS
jgi:hypothetical protein